MSTENEPQSETLSFFSSRTHLIMTAVILLVLMGVGYIAFNSGQTLQSTQVTPADSSQSEQEEKITPSPNTTSYVQITQQWPLYINPAQTFQIKHPKDWIFQNNCTAFRQFRNTVCMYDPDFRFMPAQKNVDALFQQPEQGELVVIRSFAENQYVAYNKEEYCSPETTVSIQNCREETIREQKVAIREVGNPVYEENIWYIQDDMVVMQVSRFFSPDISAPESALMLSTLSLKEKTTPIDQSNTRGSCVRTGCSGELCVDSFVEQESGGIATTCEFKEKYACYQNAICERQPNGNCGFTQTEESQQCLTNLTGTPEE